MSVSDLVGELDDVRRRTRRATAGAAVPLALLGLLVAASAPVYALASDSVFVEGSGTGYVDFSYRPPYFERFLLAHPNVTGYRGIGIFWLVAAPATFALIAWYYARRARRTGLSIDGWRVAAVGVGAFVALVLTMAYAGGAITRYGWGGGGSVRLGDLVTPFLVVALGVFALAWVERSVGAAVTGVAFVAALLVAHRLSFHDLMNAGWTKFSWAWTILGLALVLLAGAGVLALAERTRRP